jgi:hypothetical protein
MEDEMVFKGVLLARAWMKLMFHVLLFSTLPLLGNVRSATSVPGIISFAG